MPLVVMMHESGPGEYLTSAAFMHCVDPTDLIHSQRVGMMPQCSNGEFPADAALVHHDDKCCHLMTCILKGLRWLPDHKGMELTMRTL